VLAALMLRGPQTPGELKQRTERLHRFASLPEVLATLDALVSRELVSQLTRQPGQKEERYAHLLGEQPDDRAAAARPAVAADRLTELEERVTRLEAQVAELRDAREIGP
jgi:uncharacterized protein YceH (UPF0502 family)